MVDNSIAQRINGLQGSALLGRCQCARFLHGGGIQGLAVFYWSDSLVILIHPMHVHVLSKLRLRFDLGCLYFTSLLLLTAWVLLLNVLWNLIAVLVIRVSCQG